MMPPMFDNRFRIAAGMLIGVVSVLGGAQAAHAAPATEIRYECDAGQRLVVRQAGDRAFVQFIDRSYELRRRHSSIGEKYESANEALIIDGQAAVFVAADRLQLGQCLEASRTASAR